VRTHASYSPDGRLDRPPTAGIAVMVVILPNERTECADDACGEPVAGALAAEALVAAVAK
jgi:hypothetical protein